MLLDKLNKRKNAGLSTPKQIRFLESRGFQHVGTWTLEQAKNMINRYSANGWKMPRGVVPQEYKPNDK